MDADQGLVAIVIPEDRPDGALAPAIPAADAARGIEDNAAAGAEFQGAGRADLGAGRVAAGAADDDSETARHPAGGADLDAAAGDPGGFLPA